MRRHLRRLAPVVALAAGACVATRNDVRLLQQDLRVMRMEAAQADTARHRQLDSLLFVLGRANDSLQALGSRVAKLQGDVRGDLYDIGQQLIQIQELTGQSQRRLQELRASLERRSEEIVVPTPGDTSAPAGPGPNQLFQLSLDQLRRGSVAAARAGFQDLLKNHPTSDVADDAQLYIAQSYEAEGNHASADSAYARFIERYPKSPRMPTALYKRALALQAQDKVQAARALLDQVVRQYPRSDEAVLAKERLRALR